MKVSELITKLQQMNPDFLVMLALWETEKDVDDIALDYQIEGVECIHDHDGDYNYVRLFHYRNLEGK